jgi:hypothetical protein
MIYRNETSFPDERLMQIFHIVAPADYLELDGEIFIKKKTGWRSGTFNTLGGKGRTPKITAMVSQEPNSFPHFRRYYQKAHVRLYWDRYDEDKNQLDKGWSSFFKFNLTKHLKPNGLTSLLLQGSNGGKGISSSRGYLNNLVLSVEEALVHSLAHEFRHMWQWYYPSEKRSWGSKGRFSERDADAYAIRKVREWRRSRNPKDAMQVCRLNWKLIENDSFTAATYSCEELDSGRESRRDD